MFIRTGFVRDLFDAAVEMLPSDVLLGLSKDLRLEFFEFNDTNESWRYDDGECYHPVPTYLGKPGRRIPGPAALTPEEKSALSELYATLGVLAKRFVCFISRSRCHQRLCSQKRLRPSRATHLPGPEAPRDLAPR